MAGVVDSVEIFQVAVSAGNGSAASPITDTLTGGQDIDYCVPFVTKRHVSGADYEVENDQADVWFTSTATLNVARDATETNAIEVEASVVEFSSTLCNVYSGTLQLTSGVGPDDLTVTVSIGGTVNLSKSFLVFHSLQNSAQGPQYDSHLIRGRITSTTQVTFDRANDSGTCDGHWWVVECKGSDFTVDTSDIQLASTSSGQDTGISVDKDVTFVTGSWKATGTDNADNDDNTIDITLTSDTQLDVQRAGATGTIDWHGFVVEMADGTSVQHGTISGQGATGDQDVSIPTPVSLTRSIAILAGNMGSTCGGSFPGAEDSDIADAQVQLTLEDSDTGGDFDNLNVRHFTDAGEADNDISWQVIEWGTGGGSPPTRRVMVVS